MKKELLLIFFFITLLSALFPASSHAFDKFGSEIKYAKNVVVGDTFDITINLNNNTSSYDLSRVSISFDKKILDKIQIIKTIPEYKTKYSIPIPGLDYFKISFSDNLTVHPGQKGKIIIRAKAIARGLVNGKLKISAWGGLINPFDSADHYIKIEIETD